MAKGKLITNKGTVQGMFKDGKLKYSKEYIFLKNNNDLKDNRYMMSLSMNNLFPS